MILMFFVAFLQNASLTLVTRARNSDNLWYGGLAVLIYNSLWIFFIVNVINNINNTEVIISGILGSVIGSVLMQYLAKKYFKKYEK